MGSGQLSAPRAVRVFDDGLITSLALGRLSSTIYARRRSRFILLIQGSEITMFLLCFPLKT